MPLGAVFLLWVLACHTIEKKMKVKIILLSFFSLLYGTPAPSAESQHPEAWPASTYGYLRGVPDNKKLLSGTLPDNNELLSGTLPDNNLFLKFSHSG